MKKLISGLFLCSIFLVISCTSSSDNLYVIRTELGDIKIEVYPEKAPITVANFKRYVDQAIFEGAYFYRVVRMDNQPINPVKIEVIQGTSQGRIITFPSLNTKQPRLPD